MSTPRDQIPEATIARLPGYLRVLVDLDSHGVARVSSTELAEAAGVQSALLRRDLSHFTIAVRWVKHLLINFLQVTVRLTPFDPLESLLVAQTVR